MHLCGQVFQGLLERDTMLVMNVTGQQGEIVDILVENMGRVNFGSKISDSKARTKNKANLTQSPLYHAYFVDIIFTSPQLHNAVCVKIITTKSTFDLIKSI